jgi:flagellar biosynthetic protein FliP
MTNAASDVSAGVARQASAATRRARRRRWLLALALAALALPSLTACAAQTSTGQAPSAAPGGIDPQNPQNVSAGIQILLFVTVLSLAPAILVMVTSFTRIIVVLSLVRNAIGIPQLPPNQVLIGLALFLTAFIMAPAIKTINHDAVQPYLNGTITQDEAFKRGESPLRAFMLKQTREQDLGLFLKLSDQPKPETRDDVPTYVLVPAFTISELKTAFQMGFVMFVPFLIIDLVISSALLSMGMMMLPPVIVSLPFKILLFVMVDGWYLIIGSLVGSFN